MSSSSSDPDLDAKVKKTVQKISENLHIFANEPSLAFYRIQEHIRKVLPLIIERRSEVLQLQTDLQGRCYDMEYAIGAVKSIEDSDDSFKNVQELLKNAIFLKQQLKYEETRKSKNTTSNSSVYKRLSAHYPNLPDLSEISGVMRETSNRVEHIMSQARSSNSHELQRSHTSLH